MAKKKQPDLFERGAAILNARIAETEQRGRQERNPTRVGSGILTRSNGGLTRPGAPPLQGKRASRT